MTDGVVVDDVVPGSPAADAQLQKAMSFEKFDGHDVKNFPALRSLVSQVELNKKVDLEIVRNGKPMKVDDRDQGATGRLSDRARPSPAAAARRSHRPQTPTAPQARSEDRSAGELPRPRFTWVN